jgi:hypothetical protein
MPLALVHMHPDTYKVLGVWLSPNRFAYLHTKDGGAARTLGQEIMAARGSAPTWDEWARHLSEKTPTVALWQAIPRSNGEEARHVLARAVALEAVEERKRKETS